jgi:hypothetical protein
MYASYEKEKLGFCLGDLCASWVGRADHNRYFLALLSAPSI